MLLAVVTFFFKGKKELVNIEYPTSVLNHKSFKLFNIYIYIIFMYISFTIANIRFDMCSCVQAVMSGC